MQPNDEAATDEGSEDFDDTLFDTYDDDSEIDGDCNESQPCRGDEPGLARDLDWPECRQVLRVGIRSRRRHPQLSVALEIRLARRPSASHSAGFKSAESRHARCVERVS